MPRNFFFDNIYSRNEQKLIDDLANEAIAIFGVPYYYIQRTIKNFDQLYGTDTVSEYSAAFESVLYIKTIDGGSAQSEFLSKFNIEIRDQMTISIGIRTFIDDIGQFANIDRPQEGDLIWFGFANRAMVIKYVDPKPIFYQLGAIQFYDLAIEMWEYSSEQMNTGIEALDGLQITYSTDEQLYEILTSNGYFITTSTGFAITLNPGLDLSQQQYLDDSSDITTEVDEFEDFSEDNPFSDSN